MVDEGILFKAELPAVFLPKGMQTGMQIEDNCLTVIKRFAPGWLALT